MRLVFYVAIVFLTACSGISIDDATKRFYVAEAVYREILRDAVIYAQDCSLKPVGDDCHKTVQLIKACNGPIKGAIANVDVARKTGGNLVPLLGTAEALLADCRKITPTTGVLK